MVPTAVTIAVLLTCAAVIAGIVGVLLRAGAPDRPGRARVPAAAAVTLLAWLAVVAVTALAGGFARPTAGPPAVAYPLIAGAAGVVVAVRAIRPLRAVVARPQAQRGLLLLHAWRVAGGLFLVLAALGELPALFALPAGLGDIAIALSATRIARDHSSPGGRSRALRWTALGLLDLVVAVGIGAMASPGALHVFHTSPSTALLSEFPLALFPTFLVPLAIALHVLSLGALLRRPLATPPPAVAAGRA